MMNILYSECFLMETQSNRDNWVYDFHKNSLENKMKYFIDFYNKTLQQYFDQRPSVDIKDWVVKKIKWSHDIIEYLKRGKQLKYSSKNTWGTMYRPFVIKFQYFSKIVTHRQRRFLDIFTNPQSNKLICFPNPKTNILFQTLATDKIMDTGCIMDTQCMPLYTYDDNSKRHSNITNFGLELFQIHYNNKKITEDDVFFYTYAIFNDPKYQEKYKYNLQRKFPRIPLAKNFDKWAKIGKELYDLHVGFEMAKPYALKRVNKITTRNQTKLSLKRSNEYTKPAKIIIDNRTVLENVPNKALEYKFSSKCALEWILEFYKESKNQISNKSCDDPKIREKFNTYKFADYKEHVIDLLQKVTTVSVETMKLRRDLENMPWGKQPELYLKKSDASNDKTIKKLQTRKAKQSKKPKKSKKDRRKSEFQDTLDGTGQKRLS